jgi:hypothetical protein
MRKYQSVKINLVTLWTVLLLVSCGQSASTMSGKWSGGDVSMEFFKDNTCVLNIAHERLSGRWQILDDGRIKIDIAGPLGTPQNTFGKVEGKTLTLDKRILGMAVETRDNIKLQKVD